MKMLIILALCCTMLLNGAYGQIFYLNRTFSVDMDCVLRMTGMGGFILKGHIANMSVGYQ